MKRPILRRAESNLDHVAPALLVRADHRRFTSAASRRWRTRGSRGSWSLVRSSVRKHGARLVVLDAFNAAIEHVGAAGALRRFLRDVSASCSVLGCTALLTATSTIELNVPFIETAVDGVLEMHALAADLTTVRALEVTKLRGSGYLEGKHQFEITADGVVVHPRTEARYAQPSTLPAEPRGRVRLGVETIDRMLGGGFPAGSNTAILGASGAGKTILGLQFLGEGARSREPSLHFGFFEPPRRLVIDGIEGFRTSAVFPGRLKRFFAALTNELRALCVTTLVSHEIELFTPSVRMESNVSALFENLLLVRYVEGRSELHRLFSILKVRESDYDSSIREFVVTPKDIRLADFPETSASAFG